MAKEGTKKNPKKPATKAPSKPVVTRNGDVYSASWKIGDADYEDGQQCQYRTYAAGKWSAWKALSNIKPKTVSAKVTISRKKYYPHTNDVFSEIQFRVRGNRKAYHQKEGKKGHKKNVYYSPKVSSWSVGSFIIKKPNTPKIGSSWSSSLENVTTFAWEATATNSNHEFLSYTQVQTCLLTDDGTAGKKIPNGKWTTISSRRNATSSYSPAEAKSSWYIRDSKQAKQAFVRHVRVRSLGPRGVSAWAFSSHVYSLPFKPEIITSELRAANVAGGMQVDATWNAGNSTLHPVDSVELQYTVSHMISGRKCPSGASWTTANTFKDIGGKAKAAFLIDKQLGDDEGLFIRVVSKHDNNSVYSDAVRLDPVNTPKTHLANPSGLSVEAIDTTKMQTYVTVTNNSDVPDSRIMVQFSGKKSDGKTETFNICIIPHLDSVSGQPYLVQCPDINNYSSYEFKVFAFQQPDSGIKQTKRVAIDTYKWTQYTFDTKSSSPIQSSVISTGGNVPVAPTDVKLTSGDNGTVKVTWGQPDTTKYSGPVPEYSELSWSDHLDAWESTDEPQTYRVPQTHINRWNISGLEVGKLWYVRVRFIDITSEGNEVPGPWSAIADIDLTSEPNIPSLNIPTSVYTKDQKINATWVYSTIDNSDQASALIDEVLVDPDTGVITEHVKNISKETTAQNTVIEISDTEWEVGTTHYLSLSVTSENGLSSDWSNPVKINIAEPLSCVISNDSLLNRTVYSLTASEIIDNNYPLTSDEEPISSKNYYSATEVISPSNANIGSYFELVDQIMQKTEDSTVSALPVTINSVDGGDQQFIGLYYELVNGSYVKTQDTEVSVSEVSSITPLNLSTYYESIDTRYVKTEDTFIPATRIDYPDPNGLSEYYELYNGAYTKTSDTEIIPDKEYYVIEKKYYTLNKTYYIPSFSIDQCWEVDDGVYSKTQDLSFDSEKTYYSISKTYYTLTYVPSPEQSSMSTYYEADILYHTPNEVLSPDVSEISTYYEFDSGEYVPTKDTEIDPLKTYYTMAPVTYPSISEINTYYEPLTYDYLSEMPMTVTVTGAGDNGATIVYIERAEDYRIYRPDENDFNGFEGETIAQYSQIGENQITFDSKESLIGALDDGAKYRIIAVISDDLGQTASTSKDFVVHWDHQAVIPSATVDIDEDNYIAKITPEKPEGWAEGDVVDIYRLSLDKPELIIENAAFDVTYVDPYPTLGEHSGYRVVFKTANNDYITKDNQFAWIDVADDYLDTTYNLFDFGNNRVELLYNIDLSNSWSKDFKETKYLGGHIQGDWNPGVSRTGSVSSVSIIGFDDEGYNDSGTIEAMRRLATYSGICHVRTRDGSSFAADIQVSENLPHDQWDLISYTLNITRVDPEGLEGMTLAEWNEIHQGQEA